MDRWARAIEDRYEIISRDYRDLFKQGHWSWFLFPILHSGRDGCVLTHRGEIRDLLSDAEYRSYYIEFLGIMEHIVADEGMSGVLSYLGPVDYKKLCRHIDEFYEEAATLQMNEIVRYYNVIRGRCEPDHDRFLERRHRPPCLPSRPFPCAAEIKEIVSRKKKERE